MKPLRPPDATGQPSVAVAIVCICSAAHLASCLEALRRQLGAPPFQVVISHDSHITGIDALAARYPETRILVNAGARSPFELASAALRAAEADVVLLTEDHCVPHRDWVRRMIEARAPDRAAVGGRVEIYANASALDWAFYFVDFFPYAAPVRAGPSPNLSICNVAYDRDRLEAVREVWGVRFQQTQVNEALCQRYGTLWMEPASEVVMYRSVSARDACYERYAFGRLFARARIEHISPLRRGLYAALAPALPAVLLGRMMAKALLSARLAGPFLRALIPLVTMVLCWSWGEWLGYLTGRPPRLMVIAPDRGTTRRPSEDGAGTA